MCTDKLVWNTLAMESVLPGLAEKLSSAAAFLLNLWSPHGFGAEFVLAAVQRILAQTAGLGAIETVEIGRIQTALEAASNAPNRPLLLVIGLDQIIGTDAFYSLEAQLTSALSNANGIIIVMATNAPTVPWGTNELWQRTFNLHLESFRPESVNRVALECKLDPDEAWARTFGYPATLQQWIETPSVSAAALAAHASASAVAGCTPATQQLAETASLLPFFNVATLRRVRENGDDDDTAYVNFSRSINDLMAAGVVVWDMDAGWYRFADGALRRLMARKAEADGPEDAVAIRHLARQYFLGEAARSTYLQYSFVSAIYHLAFSVSADEHWMAGELCLDWIERSMPAWEGADWYAVLRAWQTGGGDWHVKDELHGRLGIDTFEGITRRISRALEKQR